MLSKLDDQATIIMGQSPPGDSYNKEGKGAPLLNGPTEFGPLHPMEKQWTTSPTKFCQAGDVLFCVRGATAGRINVADKEYCLGRGLAAIRAKSGKFDSAFLLHVLRNGYATFQARGVGSTFINLSGEELANFAVPTLPLLEQQRIAAMLDMAEALRTKRRAALAQIDTLNQSIFLDMFGDPVINSRGWPLKKFGDVGTLGRGISKHRPRNAPELLGGSYPLVQTGEIANCGGYIRAYNSTYSDVGLRQSKMWPAGTLCITIAANIAKTGILTFDACFPDSVVGFRSEEPAIVEFIRAWLSFLQKSLEENAPESAQKNINLAILRDLNVPLPPVRDQREFACRVAAAEKLKATHRTSLAELDALFASLQHRAFKGEL